MVNKFPEITNRDPLVAAREECGQTELSDAIQAVILRGLVIKSSRTAPARLEACGGQDSHR